jgi:hypothetical protein
MVRQDDDHQADCFVWHPASTFLMKYQKSELQVHVSSCMHMKIY